MRISGNLSRNTGWESVNSCRMENCNCVHRRLWCWWTFLVSASALWTSINTNCYCFLYETFVPNYRTRILPTL